MTALTRPSPYPDLSYAPMSRRPELLECGSLLHRGDAEPPCCLVGWAMHEYRMEIPDRLHVFAVPNRVEPIPISLTEPLGLQEKVVDSGPLGGRPFSAAMERRMGIAFLDGEWTYVSGDYAIFPFTRALLGLRRWCGGKHRDWPEHRGSPLCWDLVRLIVGGHYTVGRAALELEVTPERAASLLHEWGGRSWQGALDKAWTWFSNDLNEISLRSRRAVSA